MKTGRGRGDGAGRITKNGLITGRVLFIARAGDIRRQRHGAAGIKIDIFVQGNDALAGICDLLNPQSNVVDLSRRANPHFASRLDQTLPTLLAKAFDKQKFDRAVIRQSARWKNARVVQHKQVARPQKRFQFAKLAMFDCVPGAIQHHHARILTALQRTLRNEFPRQIVGVIA